MRLIQLVIDCCNRALFRKYSSCVWQARDVASSESRIAGNGRRYG
ncbi:MAG: hypothetical protein QM718_07610 [Steroidobacteraceae bacterium]